MLAQLQHGTPTFDGNQATQRSRGVPWVDFQVRLGTRLSRGVAGSFGPVGRISSRAFSRTVRSAVLRGHRARARTRPRKTSGLGLARKKYPAAERSARFLLFPGRHPYDPRIAAEPRAK